MLPQTLSHQSLIKSYVFPNRPKTWTKFALLLQWNRLPRTLKNRPIWSHCLQPKKFCSNDPQNLKLVGTTGKRIIVGGNSAGANLAVGLAHLCIRHSLPEPEVMFLAYPSLLCQMFPSPSRLLTLCDPLVMFPFLLRCLNAYSDPNYTSKLAPKFFDELTSSIPRNDDSLLSPLFTPKQILAKFPPTLLLVTDVDPCLDETVAFFNKLIRSGASRSKLEIVEGLPHGFFSYSGMSVDCHKGLNEASDKLKLFLNLWHTGPWHWIWLTKMITWSWLRILYWTKRQ